MLGNMVKIPISKFEEDAFETQFYPLQNFPDRQAMVPNSSSEQRISPS
jgi:hypothetical protein